MGSDNEKCAVQLMTTDGSPIGTFRVISVSLITTGDSKSEKELKTVDKWDQRLAFSARLKVPGSRRRFVKWAMSQSFSRNFANSWAGWVGSFKGDVSYAQLYFYLTFGFPQADLSKTSWRFSI